MDRCVINIIWYSIDVFVNLWCRELRKNSLQTNTGQCTYWPIVQLRVYRWWRRTFVTEYALLRGMLFLEGYWPTQDSQRAALVMTGILLLLFSFNWFFTSCWQFPCHSTHIIYLLGWAISRNYLSLRLGYHTCTIPML